MSSPHGRLQSATGTVALIVALLALVASAAGAGYAAATIGTAQLKNNAVTAPKIKNNAVTTKKIKNNAIKSSKVKDGSLTAADLVVEEKRITPTLSNGGEGDCVWSPNAPGLGTLGAPTYRKDRFGVVRMSGVVLAADGPGGDADCNPATAGQAADAIAFILPAAYIPAQTIILGGGAGFIAGPAGFFGTSLSLPPGAVAGPSAAILDGVTFDTAGSSVVIPKMKASGQWDGDLRGSLGLR